VKEETLLKINNLSGLATIKGSLASCYRRLAETKKLLSESHKGDETEYLSFSVGYIEQSINHYRDLLKIVEGENEPEKIIKPNLSAIPIIK